MATDFKSVCACGVLCFALLAACLMSPPTELSVEASKNKEDIVSAAAPIRVSAASENLGQQTEGAVLAEYGIGIAGYAKYLDDGPESSPKGGTVSGGQLAQAETQKTEDKKSQGTGNTEIQETKGIGTQGQETGGTEARETDGLMEQALETEGTEAQIQETEGLDGAGQKTGEPETSEVKESVTENQETESQEAAEPETEAFEEEAGETESLGEEENGAQPGGSLTEYETQPYEETAADDVEWGHLKDNSIAGAVVVMQEGREAREAIKAAMVSPTVEKVLNIREEASEEAEIVGKFYRGSAGNILEENNGWLKIQSGEVSGWVSAEYVAVGKEAERLLEEINPQVVRIDVDKLNVREKDSSESEILAEAYSGETFMAIAVGEEWVQIFYTPETVGYVSREYVTVEACAGEAVDTGTLDAYREIVELKEAERKAREKEKVPAVSAAAPTIASADDITLLAALCQYEAGGIYEGDLAVANVVLNRVRSEIFPNTIAEVIYAPGQFASVRYGALNGYINGGTSENARRAAMDALAGVNNIGDYIAFCSAKVATPSAYSSYVMIGGNCFYAR